MSRKFLLITCFVFCINFIYPKTLRLIGNYIKLEVYGENGNYILYGRNNINDKWIPLLFEDSPPTSYFRFYMNQKKLPFGEGGRGRYSEIAIKGNDIDYFWQNDNIRIELIYRLVSSTPGRSLDTLIIDVNIVNPGQYLLNMDFFSCIDTYLGEKSKEHFVLSTGEIVDMEKQINDMQGIDYIQSSSKELNIGINIFLDNKSHIYPTRLYFVNWKKVETSIGLYKVLNGRDFSLKPYSINDSAVFIEYSGQKIIPNADNKYRFIISMRNNIDLSEEYNENEKPIKEEDNSERNQKESNKENKNKVDNKDMNNTLNKEEELNFIDMNLKDLLDLLDNINKKLENGEKLTDDEIELTTKILGEIKKRKGY